LPKYLQHYENMFIKHLLECKKDTRHADDILIVHNNTMIGQAPQITNMNMYTRSSLNQYPKITNY